MHITDRVKINDKGRKTYRCAADGCNPLNFVGTVDRVYGRDIGVQWDNGFHNTYEEPELTVIPNREEESEEEESEEEDFYPPEGYPTLVGGLTVKLLTGSEYWQAGDIGVMISNIQADFTQHQETYYGDGCWYVGGYPMEIISEPPDPTRI